MNKAQTFINHMTKLAQKLADPNLSPADRITTNTEFQTGLSVYETGNTVSLSKSQSDTLNKLIESVAESMRKALEQPSEPPTYFCIMLPAPRIKLGGKYTVKYGNGTQQEVTVLNIAADLDEGFYAFDEQEKGMHAFKMDKTNDVTWFGEVELENLSERVWLSELCLINVSGDQTIEDDIDFWASNTQQEPDDLPDIEF